MICNRKVSSYHMTILVLLSIVMVFGLTGIGETAESKPITLRLTTWEPIGNFAYDTAYLSFKRAVEAESKGRLKIELYMGNTLSALKDNLDAIASGIADMGMVADSYVPDKLPLSNIYMQPPLWPNATEATRFYLDVKDDPKYGLKAEVEKLGLHRFSGFVMAGYKLFTISKPVNTIADIKGIRIRSNSKATSDFLTMLNAIPVSMSVTEASEALQKGVLDGSVGSAVAVFVPLGWNELGKPGYLADIGGAPSAAASWCINKKVYDGLSPDLQKVIDEVGQKFLGMSYAYSLDGATNLSIQKMAASGNKIIVWSDEDKAKMHAMTAGMLNEWAKDTDAKGKPGTDLAQALRARFAK